MMRRMRVFPPALLAVLLAFSFSALAQDQDGDLMPDSYEFAHACLNVAVPDGNLDPDSDGLTNLQEYQYSPQLDPCLADTDGDAVGDGVEVGNGSNPLDDRVTPYHQSVAQEIGDDLRLTYAFYSSEEPSLAWSGSEFGVAWQDTKNDNYEIYFGRVSSAGAKVGTDLRVTSDANYSTLPSLVWTGSEYGVAWADNRNGVSEIYFARISVAGAKVGSDVRVTTTSGGNTAPSLAWSGSEFGVSWQDSRNINFEIYFVRISSAGVKVGTDLRITSDASESIDPSLTWAISANCPGSA
jgi:hypothetical protein